jgi:LuxR family transcriptional regulator, quorum-sensing system regulator BjaR1
MSVLRMTFDLLDGIDAAQSPADVGRLYFAKLKPLGFGAIFVRTHALDVDDAREHVYYRDAPEGWFQIYSARNFAQANFVTYAARRTARPFNWREPTVAGDSPFAPAHAFVWDVLNGFRLTDGFAVPSHTRSSVAVMSLATYDGADLSPDRRKAIVLSSHYVHDRLRELEESPFPQVKLSGRERDCLAFAAQGKSDWDIGQILGISQATAHAHIENAKRKLGVKTRMQAVAILARAREL